MVGLGLGPTGRGLVLGPKGRALVLGPKGRGRSDVAGVRKVIDPWGRGSYLWRS